MRKRLDDSRPPYLQVADHLRDAIESGEYGPGDKLPTRRQLAQEYDIAPGTAQHALDLLRQEGLVVAHQGRGVFVREQQAETTDAQPADMRSVDEMLDHAMAVLAEVRARLDELESQDHDPYTGVESDFPPPPDPSPGIDL